MNKRNNIIYLIATGWLSLGMISTGIAQFTHMKTGAGGLDSITQLGYPIYILTFLAISKFLGVIALLLPKFPLMKEWTYAGFTFIMVVAIYSHLAIRNPITEILPALLLLILTFVSWYYRPQSRKVVSI